MSKEVMTNNSLASPLQPVKGAVSSEMQAMQAQNSIQLE